VQGEVGGECRLVMKTYQMTLQGKYGVFKNISTKRARWRRKCDTTI